VDKKRSIGKNDDEFTKNMEMKKLHSENRHLTQDIEALKSVVYRLNEELFKLQNNACSKSATQTPVQTQTHAKVISNDDENPYDVPAEVSI